MSIQIYYFLNSLHTELKFIIRPWSPLKVYLSLDIAYGSEITPCIKIDKPLVAYRCSGNVMKVSF